MSDARDLIKWMRSNADLLDILPDSIVAYGWSAGAHLVSSAAIFYDSIPEQHINSVPNAMILVSPAVSLPKGKGWEYWKYNVMGRKTTVSSVNPVEHVRTGLPPTIILQGRDDTVTPLDGVQLFHDKMLIKGNYCELWIYNGVGHLFTPNTMPDYREPHPDKEIQKEAFKKADEFLKKFGYIKE
jgi:acetyl esterase/lipase